MGLILTTCCSTPLPPPPRSPPVKPPQLSACLLSVSVSPTSFGLSFHSDSFCFLHHSVSLSLFLLACMRHFLTLLSLPFPLLYASSSSPCMHVYFRVSHPFSLSLISLLSYFLSASTHLPLPHLMKAPGIGLIQWSVLSVSLLHFSVSHCSSFIFAFLPLLQLMKFPHYLCNPPSLSLHLSVALSFPLPLCRPMKACAVGLIPDCVLTASLLVKSD